MNTYKIDISAKFSGTADLDITTKTSAMYNPNVIKKVTISSVYPVRIGLLWDGEGFYRVDKDLNVISNSNFSPSTTWPFNKIKSNDNYTYFPLVYTSAEYIPSVGGYGRVWWFDSEKSEANHVPPSFLLHYNVTTTNEIRAYEWLNIKNDVEYTNDSALTYKWYSNGSLGSLYGKMNFYDLALLQKLALIEYNPGTTPLQQIIPYTWKGLKNIWIGGTSGRALWIYGADMIGGTLRIWNMLEDSNRNMAFINTGLQPTGRWIRGNFNIEKTNGIDMGDLFFDTSSENSGYSGGITTPMNKNILSPSSYQAYQSGYAFELSNGCGILGFNLVSTTTAYLATRSRGHGAPSGEVSNYFVVT